MTSRKMAIHAWNAIRYAGELAPPGYRDSSSVSAVMAVLPRNDTIPDSIGLHQTINTNLSDFVGEVFVRETVRGGFSRTLRPVAKYNQGTAVRMRLWLLPRR